jgi:hypothetical protein
MNPQPYCFCNSARVIKDYNPECSAKSDQTFNFWIESVAMRANIAFARNGVQEPLAGVGVARMQIQMLSPTWRLPHLVTQ